MHARGFGALLHQGSLQRRRCNSFAGRRLVAALRCFLCLSSHQCRCSHSQHLILLGRNSAGRAGSGETLVNFLSGNPLISVARVLIISGRRRLEDQWPVAWVTGFFI
uniref:Uncharacterized protein n=1 Tax=Arundo donax TaxID=35708 RepID=A0A0A8Y9U5_ARUDO